MSTNYTTSIIDRPRLKGEKDLFGIDKYQEALLAFLKQTDTPITIAIQGEWGSGKTSLMNILRSNLCDSENAIYFGIWLNTWQYSLMRSPEETLVRIIAGLTQDIMNIVNSQPTSDNLMAEASKKISKGLKGLFKGVAKMGLNVVGNQIGVEGAGDIVDELFGGQGQEKNEEAIATLKAGLTEAVEKCLVIERNKPVPRKGFVFFIDDLDRIDPPVAVQILELLKNIFDIPHCIFVLAIDYDVVIKGLKPKFGELTPQNEREFRSFFDKIIQLPFSMPVTSYQVNDFVAESVKRIGIFSENEEKDEKMIADISEMANLSVGTNPRSLKRLMNTLSLIKILNDFTESEEKKQRESWEKVINFGLVCIQIAYPFIYQLLTTDPDFKSWGKDLLQRHKANTLSEQEKKELASDELFDEEWEQTLYQLCMKDVYLSNRVFLISSLLNKIAEKVPKGQELGETLQSILELSAVTSVDSTEKPKPQKKFAKIRFDSMKDVIKTLQEKGLPKETIELIENLYNKSYSTFGDLVDFSFGPNVLSFYSKIKSQKPMPRKQILYAAFQKKGVSCWMNYYDKETHTRKTLHQGTKIQKIEEIDNKFINDLIYCYNSFCEEESDKLPAIS
jgi:ABC-type dipeptide/oligopeptide/nickel transport system ATPase subunit